MNVIKEKIRKHKKVCLLFVMILIITLVMTAMRNNLRRRAESLASGRMQEMAQVERRTLVSSVSATGTVTSESSKSVKADVTGVKVMEVYIKPGDAVKAGDIICLLDSADIEKNLADAKVSLDVANQKTDIDLSSAQRSLDEAQTNRNIDVERAEQNVADAWEDYQEALSDLKKAENDYNNAIDLSSTYKKEYRILKNAAEAAEERKDEISDTLDRIQTSFTTGVNEMKDYISGRSEVKVKDGIYIGLSVTNDRLQFYTVEDIVTFQPNKDTVTAQGVGTVSGEPQKLAPDAAPVSDQKPEASAKPDTEQKAEASAKPGTEQKPEGSAEAGTEPEPEGSAEAGTEQKQEGPAEAAAAQESEGVEESASSDLIPVAQVIEGAGESQVRAEIDGYLSELKNLQRRYRETEEEYRNVQEKYQSLLTTVNEWERKCDTAVKDEKTLKAEYEQADAVADNKLEAYNQRVRNKEDAVRSGDSTVNSRKTSLESSQLNAVNSGKSDRKQIEQYEDQIAACTVTAPVDGIVTKVSVEVGDTYSSGVSIAVIENVDRYEITAQVDEYDIGKVKVGQKTVIRTNGTGDLELYGTVKEVAPRATAGSGNVTYKVVVSIDTACEELRLDMTAKLSIIFESRENVLTVPYDSVVEAEDGSFYIEVVSDSNHSGQEPAGSQHGQQGNAGDAQAALQTEKIPVTKGLESDYYVEVLGEGIREGMNVVLQKTENGMTIQDLMNGMGPMGGF